jgi:ParB-like chromosome segregation protein Spo0J
MPTIILKNPNDLTQYNRNARLHSNAQLDEIEASMLEFGWTRPIIIDENNMILAGHGRYMVAMRRSMQQVPCIVKSGLTQEEKIAYIIADNALAELAHWDEEALAIELIELKDQIDLTVTGFNFEFDLEPLEREERISSGDGIQEVTFNDVVIEAKHRCPSCKFEF